MYAAQILTRHVPMSTAPTAAPFTANLSTRSHVTLVRSPGSDVGPAPVHIPVTGHNLFLDLAAGTGGEITLEGLWAQVTGRESVTADGVSMALPRQPDLVLSPDLEEPGRRATENFQPLEIPHYEVVLDAVPALVRPARDAYGRRVRRVPDMPLRVPAGASTRVILAAVTGAPELVHWRMLADVSQGGRIWSVTWDLAVTATSGMATYPAGGNGPVSTPVQQLFPQHCALRCRYGVRPVDPGPVALDADGPVRLPVESQLGRIELAGGAVIVTIDECVVPTDPVGHPGLPAGSRLRVYTTTGLGSAGLPDVTAAVLSRTGDSSGTALDDLLGVIDTMYHRARTTSWDFGLGSTVGLAAARHLGGRAVPGMLVTYPAADGAWFPANSPPLLLVPLVAGEPEAAGRFGHGRVLAQLAAASGCFPYPWWFDPGRPAVLDLDTYTRATVLADVAIMHVPNLRLVHAPRRLELTFDSTTDPAALWETWQRAPRTFALAPRYSTGTGRARVWSPGQSSVREISAAQDASTDVVGLHFLLVNRDTRSAAARPVEDGFALDIPQRQWADLGPLVRTGTSITWACTDAFEVGFTFLAR